MTNLPKVGLDLQHCGQNGIPHTLAQMNAILHTLAQAGTLVHMHSLGHRFSCFTHKDSRIQRAACNSTKNDKASSKKEQHRNL